MSEREPMPEITEAEIRVLEELAEMRESDPEGYRALVEDLSAEEDLAQAELAHAEQLLEIFDARANERDKEFGELLNRAFAESMAAKESDQP